jgi:hypothetical protein
VWIEYKSGTVPDMDYVDPLLSPNPHLTLPHNLLSIYSVMLIPCPIALTQPYSDQISARALSDVVEIFPQVRWRLFFSRPIQCLGLGRNPDKSLPLGD